MGTAHLIGIAAHGGLHGQSGVAGAHGVIFVCQWCPEQGHNAVTKDLVHGAFIAVHCFHHDV